MMTLSLQFQFEHEATALQISLLVVDVQCIFDLKIILVRRHDGLASSGLVAARSTYARTHVGRD